METDQDGRVAKNLLNGQINFYVRSSINSSIKMNWSYIAGFFDGEGYCSFKGTGTTKAYVVLGFSNTNRLVLEEIRSFLSIKKLITGRIGNYPGSKKICYTLCIQGHKTILKIAKNLLKYSIVKRGELQKLVDFIENKRWKKSCPDIEALKELYFNQKLTCSEIAEKYGVHLQTICRAFKKHNIRRPRYRKLRDVETVKKLRLSGMSVKDIAKKYGVHPTTVNYALRKVGAGKIE